MSIKTLVSLLLVGASLTRALPKTLNDNPPDVSDEYRKQVCHDATLSNKLRPIPNSCTWFIHCDIDWNSSDHWNGRSYIKECPAGLYFHNSVQSCDFAQNVPKCGTNN